MANRRVFFGALCVHLSGIWKTPSTNASRCLKYNVEKSGQATAYIDASFISPRICLITACRMYSTFLIPEYHRPGTERAVLTQPHFGTEGVESDWPKIAKVSVMIEPQHHCITLVSGLKAY
ncbi:hypothetical protein FOTG_18994 [Fusarium oxysporum f. sp. vasinfectum 25433]|uniref:Uncharacterized protein n=1 Tax=Fusarium oxysporum f. sp. vasinfectum 25433 TaxID=1089449 RepID=X0KV04_FUSOX|nr:hypothetical protein FOTG_18994 [Fusarium oxysporum f. sp. vasinfectum 25433]